MGICLSKTQTKMLCLCWLMVDGGWTAAVSGRRNRLAARIGLKHQGLNDNREPTNSSIEWTLDARGRCIEAGFMLEKHCVWCTTLLSWWCFFYVFTIESMCKIWSEMLLLELVKFYPKYCSGVPEDYVKNCLIWDDFTKIHFHYWQLISIINWMKTCLKINYIF